MVLNYLINMMTATKPNFDPIKELKDLTHNIKRVDPAYVGQGFNSGVCEQMGINVDDIKLNDDDKNLCAVLAAMEFTRAQVMMAGEGGRAENAIDHLIEYIDELGAKVPERMGFVKAAKAYERDAQKYLDVQMKPHEPQKVKKGKLKFGRMVVSIVGQGWIEANPTVWYDNKHILEEPIRVDNSSTKLGEFTVTLKGIVREFKYPYPGATRMKRSFYGQTVITKTQLDGLSEVFTDMEEQCEMEKNLYCFCNHGDDQAAVFRNNRGEVTWCEADLANNDSSHVDASFRSSYLVDRYRGEDVVEAYSQLAYPVKLVNPTCTSEYGFFRPTHGMRLPSGSVATTTLNSKKSEGVGVAHAFYGCSYELAAERVGCEVTTKYGELEEISFLSKVFYRRPSDKRIECALDLASVARKFGAIVGDARGKGSTPVWKRIVDASIGVVKGHVNEPDSAFIKALRKRYAEVDSKVKMARQSLKRYVGIKKKPTWTRDDLTYIDHGILSHYYTAEEVGDIGIDQYLAALNQLNDAPQYGAVMFSKFIDRTMQVRYGLAPTVVE
jgi:hypothetical protein